MASSFQKLEQQLEIEFSREKIRAESDEITANIEWGK